MRRALAVLLLVSCAHAKTRPAKCPDKPPCMSTLACAYDEDTGCDVCRCSDTYIDRGAEPPPGQPPFPSH